MPPTPQSIVKHARNLILPGVLLLVQSFTGYAQSVVPVGSGSYASSVPAVESTTDSYYALPQGQVSQFYSFLHLDPSLVGQPIPTNHWWTDLLVANRSFLPTTPPGNTQYTLQQDLYGGNQWFVPGMLDPQSYGIDVYYANSWKGPNSNGSPQGTFDPGVKLPVKGDIPYGFQASDVLIADFENGYPTGSTITGNAFPTPPSTGSGITNLASGHLANTRDGGNGVQGTLTLPSFTISKHYLNFQICGGNTTATQVRLIIGGTTVLAASGVNSTSLQWVSWDVSPYAGQTAQVQIVDASTASWGFIAADQFFLSDSNVPAGRFGGDMVASNTTVTNWGDWNVDFNLADANSHKVDVTMARGIPFTWTRWTGMNPKIVLGAATTFYDTTGTAITVTGGTFTASSFAFTTAAGKTFGVFLPDNTVCTVGGTGTSTYVEPALTGGANNYMVIGYLPAVSNLSEFGTYAFARPTNTQLSWALDAPNGRVTTTWNITTTAMKGSNLLTLQGWLPHHYRTTTTNFSFKSYTYQTPRGTMKVGAGTSFQINFPFQGFPPALPAPQQLGLTNDFQPGRMQTYLNNFNPGTMLGETYGSGKALYLCAKYMVMADQMGDSTNFNRLKSALTTALQNWLTYTPGEANGYFAMYTDWKALIGWDASYGSQAFNDLHFHYGYFTAAAALLGKYDKTFLTNYGPMMRLVVKTFANSDRSDLTEPFLRMFDVWEGHSNAGGLGSADGENQESSSEAMNSWVGIYLLGSMLNDSSMTALGAMGFAMESHAVNEYWEDLYQANFPPNFNVSWAGMVWSDNFTHATYFSGDPIWIYAIQEVPSAHWLNYLVRDQPAAVSSKFQGMWTERQAYYNSFTPWNSTTAYAQFDYVSYNYHVYYALPLAGVAAGGATPDVDKTDWSDTGDYSSSSPDVLSGYPGDYVLAYQALFDHVNTPVMFDNYYAAGKDIATNNTWAGETYYLIHAMRQTGDQDFSYTSDIPTAAVYYNSTTNVRTAVVYNPSASTVNANIYKNGASVQTVSVPGYSTATAFVGTSPVITSSWNAAGMIGGPGFSYQITATNTPTSYSVTGALPAGLSVSPTTGLISGNPTTQGTTSVTINATNANGTGSKNLTITVYPFTNPPVINSATTAPATVGTAFSYQIAATNSPFSFDAVGLPAGLSVSTSTGLITGTPSAAGTTSVTIKATNAAGTATATLVITTLANLSLNQPVTASTFATGSEPTKANDGSTTSRWTASGNSYPQWWRVDLGSSRSVSRVDVHWYSTASRAYKYRIEASDDDASYATVFDNTTNSTFADTSNSFTTVTKRYVRVTITGVTPTGGTASAYEITVLGGAAASAPVITSAGTATGTAGSAFTYQIAGTNTPTSYSIASGTLPTGLSLNPTSGLISGTPSAAGSASVTIGATNAIGTGTAPLAITINPPAPVISSPTTAGVTAGTAFSYQIVASNSPTSYSLTGTLPAGLTFSTSTGIISGTTSAVGTANVTIGATNAGGTGTASLAITVVPLPPVISSATTASGMVGNAFTYQIVGSNSPTGYGVTGSLPTGLSLDSASGIISGTPSAAGTSNVTISATNAGGTGTASLSITISPPPPVISSATTASGMVGTAFSYQIAGSNSPTGYGVTGSLPTGLSLDSASGIISGTPSAAGTSSVTISASNTGGTGTGPLTITIVPQPPVISSATTASGMIGTAFSYQIVGSNSPTGYGVTGSLPTGLSFDSGSGIISGTPSATGTSSVTISATNAGGTGTASLTITIVPQPPVLSSATTASGMVGTAFSYQIVGSNSPTGYGVAGSLPSGLSFDSGSGIISGTPLAAGAASVTISATNAGGTGTASLSITIVPPPPVVSSATTASGMVGTTFSYQIVGSNSPTSYGVTGSLPSGLSFDSGSGIISGTPLAAGTSSVTISATNAGGTGTASLSITIVPPPPAITSSATASAVAGTAFSYQIVASNSPTGYGLTGTLPTGLSFDSASGIISGTTSVVGTSNVTISASNAGGTGTASLTITITQAVPVITSPLTATGTVGTAFSYQIVATNSPTVYGATGLPAGLSIAPSTGVISGTPSTIGTSSVTISASNSGGTGTATLVIAVNGNISQGLTSFASSFQAGNLVANGNDGSGTTRWAASGTTYPQWWMVDLGASKTLSTMNINWYSNTSRAYKYRIETSPDNTTFTTQVDKTSNVTFGNTSDPFPAATTARYVRVTITGCTAGGAYASAYEFQVFGH